MAQFFKLQIFPLTAYINVESGQVFLSKAYCVATNIESGDGFFSWKTNFNSLVQNSSL